MRIPSLDSRSALCLVVTLLGPALACRLDVAQNPAGKSGETQTEKKPLAQAAAQIELLETRVRFEADGSSRREVHARVRINSELGAREYGRLTFDYNRAFEQVELPLVRVTHASGGRTEILPSAISDQPNPTVVDAPAYQDVRRKSVRVLGLAPGGTLEYRAVTIVSHHPLAPDFWLSHSFARGDTVTQEIYEIDLPASRQIQIRINAATPASTEKSGEGSDARVIYRWQRSAPATIPESESLEAHEPDLILTTFASWQALAERLAPIFSPRDPRASEVAAKASELVQARNDPDARIMAVYEFVSQKIRSVALPLGATGYRTRPPAEILSSGFATPEDKLVLFAALGNRFFGPARAALVLAAPGGASNTLPLPSAFDYLLTMSGYPSINFLMDLNLEVAPYRMIPSQYRGRQALLVGPAVSELWWSVDKGLPFPATQKVEVDATLAVSGKLSAKVRYRMRGDNELLLRIAFHKQPREKWNDLGQLLSLSDGFRGQVGSVMASDPYATRDPFTVEYEISQPRFVDWKKQPVRIPALLPQLGLPDLPAKAGSSAASSIELGTPLDVETRVTLHLPAGTKIHAPAGTSVQRDYATFSSSYAATSGTATASRRLKFVLRELPASRAADYAAFARAVQNDESQEFVLERSETTAESPRPKR